PRATSVLEKKLRSIWIARNQLEVDIGAIQPTHFSDQGFGEINRIGQLETVEQRLSIGVQCKSFNQMFLVARRKPVRDTNRVFGKVGSRDNQDAILPSSE